MKAKIRDIGKVVTGKTPSFRNPEHFGSDIPFITPTDMQGERILSRTERMLSPSGAEALRRLIIPKGVGVSCIGWQMGKSVFIDRPSVTNQQINSIIVDESKADCLFVYYSMMLKRDEIFRLGSGGSRTPILKKSLFEELDVWLPPLDGQRAIARILSSLDDKIELNRQMNHTLEETARAIFKSWFVDFDPVVAKSEGRQPYGMNTETAALFPSAFQDSELGPIPKGWRVGKIGDVAQNIRHGVSPNDVQPDTPYIGLEHMPRKSIALAEWGRASDVVSNKFAFNKGEILFGKLRPYFQSRCCACGWCVFNRFVGCCATTT